MAKTISLELNTKSIQDVINYLKDYQKSLSDKNINFINRLLSIGVQTANYYVATAVTKDNDLDANVLFNFTPMGNVCTLQIILGGEDALFFEFGSGAHYNPGNLGASNPLGNGKYGVGTYPGQTHAYNDEGWWYVDKNGEARHSYGVQATMPLYRAQLTMMENITQIAREVFSFG